MPNAISVRQNRSLPQASFNYKYTYFTRLIRIFVNTSNETDSLNQSPNGLHDILICDPIRVPIIFCVLTPSGSQCVASTDFIQSTADIRKNMSRFSKYDYLLKEYPAVITKDQFYRICNISKKRRSIFWTMVWSPVSTTVRKPGNTNLSWPTWSSISRAKRYPLRAMLLQSDGINEDLHTKDINGNPKYWLRKRGTGWQWSILTGWPIIRMLCLSSMSRRSPAIIEIPLPNGVPSNRCNASIWGTNIWFQSHPYWNSCWALIFRVWKPRSIRKWRI